MTTTLAPTTAPPASNATLLRAYHASAANVDREVTAEPATLVEGTLPDGLRGVLYRNGPGRDRNHGVPYAHPFDGDGMVTRLAFTDAGVTMTNRFVRTREFLEEEAAGRPLYRSFGSNLPGGPQANLLRLRFKNAANTNVVRHGGRLMALWEGGLPHTLDPETLETLAREDLEGCLRNKGLAGLMMPELPFSAHPKIDPDTGEMFNFGTLLGMVPKLVLYRLNPAGKVVGQVMHRMPQLSFVHDWALTDRHLVVFLPAVAFDTARALLGFKTPVDSITRRDEAPTAVWVLDRHTLQIVRRHTAPPGFVFHFANAFERGEDIFVDGCRYPHWPDARSTRAALSGYVEDFPAPKMTRFRLRAGRDAVTLETWNAPAAELPTIDPRRCGRPHGAMWTTASPSEGPFHTAITRYSPETGEHRVRDFSPCLMGEPLFVPSSERAEEGWLLSLGFGGEHDATELWLVDCATLNTVCRWRLPQRVPLGFHGTFQKR